MKKLMMGVAVLGLAATSQAVLVDDFSGDLGAYASTVILDAGGTGTNTYTWQINGSGQLEMVTAAYDGIEQYAMIRSGLSLAIGEELQADLPARGGSQDIGLYVGGVAPTTGVRVNYVNVYARNNGQLFSAGATDVAGVTITTAGYMYDNSADKLFIARTADGTFECGYYVGTTRNIIVTRTGLTYNDADNCGFYADVRAVGTTGYMDNLTVIPEPATIGLIGVFGVGMFAVRRRFAI